MLAPRIQQALLVAFVTAIVMFTYLGGARLWDRDEPRNAGCAREMLEHGDWVVPTFNAKLRTHKPVLLYWCIMSAYSVLGVSEFSARLPSAICAVGTTLCTWFIGRRLFGPRAGVWAGIALASSLMFGVAGRAATPDSVLIFCTTLATAIYVAGTFRARFDNAPADTPPQLVTAGHYFPQHWPTVAAMYAVMGLAVLAKGPVGLVLPTAVIGMFLLIMRLPVQTLPPRFTLGLFLIRILRPFEPMNFLRTCWYMRPLTAIVAAAAVALPWYSAVHLATGGEWTAGFFWEHNVGRATQSMEGHGGGALWFYPVAILLGFFPWSCFAIPLAMDAGVQTRRRDGGNAGYVLAICWVAVYIGLFSIARTKLPSYITPCYPGLALLAGSYVDRASRDGAAIARWWLPLSFAVLAASGVAIAVAVPLVAKRYLPGEEWLGLLGLTPLAGGVACIGLAAIRNYRAAAIGFGGSAVALSTMIFAIGAPRADVHQTSHVLLRAAFERASDPQLASYKILEPSWVFYAGRPIEELPHGNSAVREATGPQQIVDHLTLHSEGFVIITDRSLADLAQNLPPHIGVVAETGRFLKDERLLLLGLIDPAMNSAGAQMPPYQPQIQR
ncbi:MAG: glycosyltransferase family 39 protein [Planctomycetaceae bacterium]|nr:glycosyltransferase family 39 protein [Planctomycetaceae bacterium]